MLGSRSEEEGGSVLGDEGDLQIGGDEYGVARFQRQARDGRVGLEGDFAIEGSDEPTTR